MLFCQLKYFNFHETKRLYITEKTFGIQRGWGEGVSETEEMKEKEEKEKRDF